MSTQIKFTNESLLTHYLPGLTLIDTTHNNKNTSLYVSTRTYTPLHISNVLNAKKYIQDHT